MTRRVKPIETHAGEAYVEISAADAKNLGIGNNELIKVISRRGQVEIRSRISRLVPEGTLFIPMHYREAAANVITNDALDPDVKIPEFKVCAVRIAKNGSH